jgi:ligand-binding sensor domain-containing protein
MKYAIFIFSTLLFISFFACKEDDGFIVAKLDDYAISSLVFDNAEVLWVATDNGLFKSTTNGYEKIEVDIDAPITTLSFESGNNTLWVGTKNGISKIDLASGSNIATPISVENLSHRTILSSYIDAGANNWFGTELGITRNKDEKWQYEKFKKNLTGDIAKMTAEEYPIYAIGSWDGDYYFATGGNKIWRATGWDASIDAFTGASMLDYPYNGQAIADTMFVVFIDSKGQQWFGGVEGVQVHIGHDTKIDNTSFYDELVNPRVHCVAEANDGKIWAGTENGISIYDGENWSASTAALPNNFVTAIAFDKNNKAFIGTKKGLAIIN